MKASGHNRLFMHSGCLSENALLDYYSGKLSDSDRIAVEQHLIECEFCSDAFDGLLLMEGPETFSENVKSLNDKILLQSSKTKKPKRLWLAISVAASILILAAYIFLLNGEKEAPERQLASVIDSTERSGSSGAIPVPKIEPKTVQTKDPEEEESLISEKNNATVVGGIQQKEEEIKETAGSAQIDIDSTNYPIDIVTIETIEADLEKENQLLSSKDIIPEVVDLSNNTVKATQFKREVIAEPAFAARSSMMASEETEQPYRDFSETDSPPHFPGGKYKMKKFLKDNTLFPQEAYNKRIAGQVTVGFFIEKDGTLSNIHVINSLGYGCDEEAVRLISSMPYWTPGIFQGDTVKVFHTLQIPFETPITIE